MPTHCAPNAPLRILVWCPIVNPGGGLKILVPLTRAIATQSVIDCVRLAVPSESLSAFSAEQFEGLPIEVVALDVAAPVSAAVPGRFLRWLHKDQRFCGIKGTARLKRVVRLAILKPKVAHFDQSGLSSVSHDMDLVYVSWPHRAEFVEANLPVVFTFQDAILLDFPEIMGGWATNAEWFRSREWLTRSQCVVVSSVATQAALERHFGLPPEQTTLIHHAIVPDIGRIAARHISTRSLPSRYVVFPAPITIHKNHYNLFLAWAQLPRADRPPLVLFGSGTNALNSIPPDWPDEWQAARLVGLLHRLGLRAGQDFYALDYVDDGEALSLIQGALALVMPTLAEGGGSFPIEEALAVGVPVLCSDIPVLREHLTRRSARVGWFDPNSPESIAAAVQQLLVDYVDYKQSATEGAADDRPSWDEVGAQYAAVFETAVAGWLADE